MSKAKPPVSPPQILSSKDYAIQVHSNSILMVIEAKSWSDPSFIPFLIYCIQFVN